MVVDVVVLAAAYAAVVAAVGPAALVRTAGLALLLSLVVEDVIILSQHTHVPMDLSRGRAVAPYRARAQGRFTRSLRLPAWLSRMLLHLDAHEIHHLYPAVPGYRLREIPQSSRNEVGWAEWVPAARAVPGEVFLFQNRNQSAYGLLGTWTALGFMAGELPNSFIKRRLDIPPGAAAQGRRLRLVFFVADRLDSTAGMLLALALVVPVSPPLCLFVLLAGPSVHAAFSAVLFLLRVKARAA